MDWSVDEKGISGELDEETSMSVEDIFGVEGLDINPDYNLSDTALDSLGVLGTDVFSDLSEGTLNVDGDSINLSGILADGVNLEDLKAKWGSLSGINLDLHMPENAGESNTEAQVQAENR